MSNPYVGEIRLFGGNFAPQGWAFCDGQLLPIAEYDTLFNLIGTTYGGDGQTTFALPDLRGRVPVHQGSGGVMGQPSGAESVTLTVGNLPRHTHPLVGTAAAATASDPAGMVPAAMAETTTFAYGTDAPATTLAPGVIGLVGGSQPHDNMQPYLAVSLIIALYGIYPSQA